MIYRLVEHYNDDIVVYENNKIEECFICFEFIIEDNIKPINLKSQCYYLKSCSCGGWIHKICLDVWGLTNNKCPVCRNYMTKNNKIVSVMIKNDTLLKEIYLFLHKFLHKNLFRILRFLFVTVSFFYVIEIVNRIHICILDSSIY
jgi:hypothetical protein